MARTYEFNVFMSCGGKFTIPKSLPKFVGLFLTRHVLYLGCAAAVKRAVDRIPEVISIEISVADHTVTVVTKDDVTLETVSEAIKRSGKDLKSSKVVEEAHER